MPIGAAIGTAVVGGGAAILGSKAQKKAAGQAADANEAATAAQLQLGRESLGLNRDIYNSNYDMLSPYVSRGDVAGQSINAMLGLPAAPRMTSPIAAGGSSGGGGSTMTDDQWAQGALNALAGEVDSPLWAKVANITDPSDKLAALEPLMFRVDRQVYGDYISGTPRPLPGSAPPPAPGAPAPGQPASPAVTQMSAQQAFKNFTNSAGMKFQMDTAHDAINNGYAGAGALQSGAAMKEISDRSQDIALNNYFLPYMNLLGGQQAVGAQTGAAVAGVGSNFGNTAAGINSGMGGAIGAGAANAGTLALANGQNQANMWANLGSSFGNALGAIK